MLAAARRVVRKFDWRLADMYAPVCHGKRSGFGRDTFQQAVSSCAFKPNSFRRGRRGMA